MYYYDLFSILNRFTLQRISILYSASYNNSFNQFYKNNNLDSYTILQLFTALYFAIKNFDSDLNFDSGLNEKSETEKVQFIKTYINSILDKIVEKENKDDKSYLSTIYLLNREDYNSSDIISKYFFPDINNINNEGIIREYWDILSNHELNKEQRIFIEEFTKKLANFLPSDVNNFIEKVYSSSIRQEDPKGYYRRNTK